MTQLLSTPETRQMPWGPDTSLLDAAREIAPIVREHSQEAERERRLSQPVLKALRETGLLRMTTPRSLGGLETDPVTRALVVQEIGRHDSAAAWTLENPLDWAFLCCRLPDEGAEEIYSRGADILIAGQFGRPLQATSTNGGYRISGRAPFVSNCYDADWILSMVVVDEDESATAEPEMRMVYFPSEQCEIIDTWDVMGMRGTGSNDISVTDVYVPKSRTFPFVPDFEPGSHYRGPLYRLPVVGVAATGIPTPMLGVARRAGVAFHQRARHVVGGQEDGAGQPGQPASDNQHRRLRRRHRVPLSAAHRVVRANVRLS
jgi:indole-3-acetate monooxygenase